MRTHDDDGNMMRRGLIVVMTTMMMITHDAQTYLSSFAVTVCTSGS